MRVSPGHIYRPIGILNRSTELRHSKVKYKFIFLKGIVPAVAVVIAKIGSFSNEDGHGGDEAL